METIRADKAVQHEINNLRQAEVFADDYKRENMPLPKGIEKLVDEAKPQLEKLRHVQKLLHAEITDQDILEELEKLKPNAFGKTKEIIEACIQAVLEGMGVKQ